MEQKKIKISLVTFIIITLAIIAVIGIIIFIIMSTPKTNISTENEVRYS